MPILDKATAEFSLAVGVDEKSDEKVVNPPKLQALQNVRMDEDGKVQKRHPYTKVGATLIDGTVPPAKGGKLYQHRREGIILSDLDLYGYGASADKRVSRTGSSLTEDVGAIASTRSVPVPGIVGAKVCDYARTGSYELIIAGLGSTFMFLFRDAIDGAVLFTRTRVLSANSQARAVAVGATLMAVYNDGGNLKTDYLNTASIPTSLPNTTIATDVHATSRDLDVVAVGSAGYAAYTAVTPVVLCRKFSATGVNQGAASTAGNADQAISVTVDATGSNLFVSWASAAGGVEAASFDTTPALRNASVVDAGATTCKALTSGFASASANYRVYYEVQDATLTGVRNISWREGASNGSGGWGAATTLYGFSLFTTCFSPGTNDSNWIVLGRSTTSPLGEDMVYLLTRFGRSTSTDVAMEPIALWHYQSADVQNDENVLSHVYQSGSLYYFAGIFRDNIRLDAAPSGYSWDTFPARFEWAFEQGNAIEIGDSLAIAGSALYAGDKLEQLGLFYPPVIQLLTPSNGAGALTSSQVYKYAAVYEFMDRAGNLHRSAASRSVSVTLGSTEDTVTVRVTTQLCRQAVVSSIVLYRTTAGGTSLMREVARITSTTADALTGTSHTFTDLKADSAMSTNEILYTESGAADNAPAPSSLRYELHKERLWCVDHDTGNIKYTKQILPGEAPTFADGFEIVTDTRPSFIKSIGNALAVFWLDKIGLVYGEGPNDAGLGGSFAEVQVIEGSGVGCVNRESIISTPFGIMFEDPHRWIHVMPHGGGVPQYVGADVEDSKGATIVGADLVDDKQEVRFTLSTGVILVFHYRTGQWWKNVVDLSGEGGATFAATAMWNAKHTILDSSGELWQEDTAPSDWRDASGAGTLYVPVSLETPWYKLDGIEGLLRIYEAHIVGEWQDEHTLAVTVYYDYDRLDFHVFNFAEDDLDQIEPYRVRLQMRKQKLTAFMLKIVESAGATATTYKGAAFNATRIVYGRQKRRAPALAANGTR